MELSIETLSGLLAKRFKIDPAKVKPESTLEELGFDSLSSVDLILLLEKQVNLYMSDEESTAISTIADILDYASAKELVQ
ncbi:MAG: phosphopantetheine-binding protein [Aliidongia sp.]|jgi:acyl carrier protein